MHALHHVQLAMPAGGEDSARAFYSELLGIPEVPKPAPLAARGGVWFERGDLRVHLGVEADFSPARQAHPALACVDFTAMLERLAAAEVELKLADDLEGCRRGFVDDPFGNRVELIEAHPAHFAVLYRWRLDPACVDDFRHAWQEATHRIRDERGGLGSRLHHLGDGVWAAYAQWPSRASWLASQRLGPVDKQLSARMSRAIVESFDALEMHAACDLLSQVAFEAAD